MQKAVFVLTALLAAVQAASASCLITKNSIGGVSIGQTLAEAKHTTRKSK